MKYRSAFDIGDFVVLRDPPCKAVETFEVVGLHICRSFVNAVEVTLDIESVRTGKRSFGYTEDELEAVDE